MRFFYFLIAFCIETGSFCSFVLLRLRAMMVFICFERGFSRFRLLFAASLAAATIRAATWLGVSRSVLTTKSSSILSLVMSIL